MRHGLIALIASLCTTPAIGRPTQAAGHGHMH
jgi:hypothetical protein